MGTSPGPITPARVELTDDEREWWEERAAIIEHLGGEPRHWAEAMAMQMLRERQAVEGRAWHTGGTVGATQGSVSRRNPTSA